MPDLAAADAVRTGAAFADPAAVGPWFAAQPDANDWQSTSRLYRDQDTLEALLDRLSDRIRCREHRVAASMLHLGWAGRVFSLSLGMIARHGLVPDLTRLQWRDEAGSVSVRMSEPAAFEGSAIDALDQVLDEHLEPLADGLQELGRVAPAILRGNAASAVLGAARVVDAAPYGPANELARAYVQDPRLEDGVHLSEAGWRRRSCCLFYRSPGTGLCGDCVLDQLPASAGRRPSR